MDDVEAMLADEEEMRAEQVPKTEPTKDDEFGDDGFDWAAACSEVSAAESAAVQGGGAIKKRQQVTPPKAEPPSQGGMNEDEFGDDSFDWGAACVEAAAAESAALQGGGAEQKLSPGGMPSASPPRAVKKRPAAKAFEQSDDGSSLTATLRRYFGYDTFREGQREVVQTILSGRDAAVFWATGQGKSLCYQVPALHTGRTAVVVSPLISLMVDQCAKLNATVGQGQQIATFLGSGQMDFAAEEKALRGEFLLLYVTPEKLTSGGFLSRLAALHGGKPGGGLSLVAVDEAHCVSAWGHDFRPAFRSLGEVRRTPGLDTVPMMALTATAVPRVQRDIVTQLGLDSPHVALLSFDRSNLAIRVRRKPPGGYAEALGELIDTLKARPHGNSTIVYAPTRSSVDTLAAHLKGALRLAGLEGVVTALPYHAGLSPGAREDAHNGFLVGEVQVIVATVAFGMGIDKPDTRRVLHWGAPKTVEEYYQQIGRAGRDGLLSEVTMYANDSDFNRYDCDFYLGELEPDAKAAVKASLSALRRFAMDGKGCRRAALLHFFEESPSFGARCGTCDNCENAEKFKDDLERDFPAAHVVLHAVKAQKQATKTNIATLCGGSKLKDAWRYAEQPALVAQRIAAAKERCAKRLPNHFYCELLEPLVQEGFLQMFTESTQHGAYSVYVLGAKGTNALRATPGTAGAVVRLPVPDVVRQIEAKEEEARAARLSKVKATGVDMSTVPLDEIKAGHGPVISAHLAWAAKLEHLERTTRRSTERPGEEEPLEAALVERNTKKAAQLRALLQRLTRWRLEEAKRSTIAPHHVLEEHLMRKIAYTCSSGPMAAEALRELGVRIGIDSLVAISEAWCEEAGIGPVASAAEGSPMVLGDADRAFTPARPWALAVYKPIKSRGNVASWESSHKRFQRGDHLQSIASNPEYGKGILPTTVVGHVLEGLVQGRAVYLKRLAMQAPVAPPNSTEWEKLEEAMDAAGVDVVTDKPSPYDVIVKIDDSLAEIIAMPFGDRSDEQKATLAPWLDAFRWFSAFKRAGYTPNFERGGAGGGGGGGGGAAKRHCM